MDKIRLHKLTCYGYHGVLPEENRLGQTYEASIEIELDLKSPGNFDDISQTLDYREVLKSAEAILTGPPCKLIETLAERIAQQILALSKKINAVTVEVTKPAPPVPQNLQAISATIHRTR